MKKYLILFISILMFSCTLNTKALTSSEIKSRNVCSKFELATANSNKSLTKKACYNTYDEAKAAMNKETDTTLVILERSGSTTRIIDAKEALVYLGVKSSDTNTNYYSSSSLKTSIGYMNHNSAYGASDGVFLELNYSNHAIKVYSNGVAGWIKDGYYIIVPLNFVIHSSYYQITSSEVVHYYSGNIETSITQSSRAIDKKPSQLAVGKYYSQDGHYFYTKLSDMVEDYKANSHNRAVNKNAPYYNYYMYLPHRSRSSYTSDDIDAYLKNGLGFQGTIYGKKTITHYSHLFGAGIYFKSSENLYGANAILMLSLSINESSYGQSNIAVQKNNLFGHSAYDSSPFASATGYLDAYQSIIGHANGYINCGYANPKDSRYRGSNMGTKSSGMNIKYASDPYWGEKAANYYYKFDKYNGFQDYNYYQLGITNIDEINTRKEPNLSSAIPFMLNYKNIPVIILDEVKGDSYNGNTTWYKIMADPNLNSGRTGIQGCSASTYYNWNSYVYVNSTFIDKINTSKSGKYVNPNSIAEKNYTYTEYASSSNYTPKVGVISKDSTLYDTSTLTISSGVTIKKGNLTPIYMEAKLDNKAVAYLVNSDYTKNQRRWVSASNITFTDKDLLKVTLVKDNDYLNVYNKPGGSVLGSVYTDTFSVIVNKQTYNKDLWLQIYYGANNTLAWINTNVSSSKGTLTYTLNKLNQAPVINASNKTIYLNSTYNPLTGVTATDAEDGNLTKSIQVTKNTVNPDVIGTYDVTYEVTDSAGLKTTKAIKVYVKDYTVGNSLFIYESLKQVSGNIFEFKGFLGVKKMNNTNLDHKLNFINQKTNKKYTYKMGDYKDYPYEVNSLDDDKVYNYSDGWFKGNVDLSELPEGDYTITILAYNRDTGKKTETNFTNIAYQTMPRRVAVGNRGYSFEIDYSYAGSPLVMLIRDKGLISYDVPETYDAMYNFFTDFSLKNTTLSIMGTSHNFGVSYSKNDDVKREIIFENTDTFERFNYNLGYIDNGPYKVTMALSDNKDKTRAWYKNSLDLSKLPTGNYAIYIKTTSNNKTFYGELVDIAYTDFSKINTSKYVFKRVNEKRMRVELTVK